MGKPMQEEPPRGEVTVLFARAWLKSLLRPEIAADNFA
jgi:hypothetical protein